MLNLAHVKSKCFEFTAPEFWNNQHFRNVESDDVDEIVGDLIALSTKIRDQLDEEKVAEYRMLVGSYSFKLSALGIAPRWSGLIHWQGRGDCTGGFPRLARAIRNDRALYDLVWLSRVKEREPDVLGILRLMDSAEWKRRRSSETKLKLASETLGIGTISDFETCGCIELIFSKNEKAIRRID